jgi:two-component system, chemotaxis family, sensor kinase Cph1
LWGLIACHHSTPRALSYQIRAACELIGQIVSSVIAAREEKERFSAMLEAQKIQTHFFDHLAKEENVLDALAGYTPKLLELVDAKGAALCLHGRVVLVGLTPNETQVREIIEWVKAERGASPIFVTEELRRKFPPAAAYEKTVSGLLAISLSREGRNYILWFRPEVPATIDWAGNPDKASSSDGMRIHPRHSFKIWQQQVTGRSLPWREVDKQAAQELRNAINALILRRADRLLRLNAELERKNVDLNSFAHIAAHDLQEPLRGLRETSAFLLEDFHDKLGEDGREKLQALASLAQHMQELIRALQHFSKVGRIEIKREELSLDQLLQDARAAAGSKLDGVEIRVPQSLPVVRCDRILIREVLLNLLTNAVKYNTRDDRFIEIGTVAREGEPVTVYVRDNGIGIREKHLVDIFKIFRRLHPHERFAGGTGVGLAVCKAIVERHGGEIWCSSIYGEGSTFHFTLP